MVARSIPGQVIGCDDKVPWRLRTDMRLFRERTIEHVVIMGRKTYQSIGRPLPNRINVVISRKPGNSSKDLIWVDNKEDALYVADHLSIRMQNRKLFVIGGAEIYKMFERQFNLVYLTEVFADVPGDAFFRHKFDFRRWNILEDKFVPKSNFDEYDASYLVYERRTLTVRQVELWRFLKKDEELEAKLPDRDSFRDTIRRTRRSTAKLHKLAEDLEAFLK